MVVDKLSAAFAAVSDPTRRMLLARLARGPATVNDLAEPFEISQQAISKHLAYLERAHLVKKQRRGREQVCTLKAGPIQAIGQWADGYRRFYEASFARLDAALPQIEKKERQSHARKR